MKKTKNIIFATLLCSFIQTAVYAEQPRQFPYPDRIRYDSQCLTIDGTDTIIYSGSFHYFRCPKELWRDRFQKMKDAGLNTVETYTPWNWHEREMPSSPADFSKVTGLQDFDDWLTMAEDFGFYVIVRPGPYICAEWDNGGFPLWLSALKAPTNPLHKEGWMRSDDPTFLNWTKHWFDAVCPIIAKHQITHKGPGKPGVILVQVENEYDSSKFSDEIKINQVKALAQFARADGIDVPLITCWTKQVRGSSDPVLRQIFDCCNFYPQWNVAKELGTQIPKLRSEQPDAPLATTELQGGWLSVVGGKLSEDQNGLTAAQIQNITLFALQMGETIMNYYMVFGGTDFDDWGGYNITTTYDYNAPIRENGGVGERYQRVRAIGRMLSEYGAGLVRSHVGEIEVAGTNADVKIAERRGQDGSRYFFVRTDTHKLPVAGSAHVKEKDGTEFTFDYKLEPFGSLVLYLPPGERDAAKGKWLPKPAPEIKRPENLPQQIILSEAQRIADPLPSKWQSLTNDEPIEAHGVYSSHFIYYKIPLNSGKTNPAATIDIEVQPGDGIVGACGGAIIPSVMSKDKRHFTFKVQNGAEYLEVLHDKHGHRNGPKGMEVGGTYGLLSVKGMAKNEPLQFAAGGLLDNEREAGEALARGETVPGNDWQTVPIGQASQPAPDALLTWYQMRFELPTNRPGVWVPWHLHLEANGNGFIYVNGRCLGRYWQVGPQHDFYIPETWLEFGGGKTNSIALDLRPLEKGVSLQAVQVVPDNAYAEFR